MNESIIKAIDKIQNATTDETTALQLESIKDELRILAKNQKAAISLLREYERWEADIIIEDKLWWPQRAKDVLRGPIYDKMLELQEKRNEVLGEAIHPLFAEG